MTIDRVLIPRREEAERVEVAVAEALTAWAENRFGALAPEMTALVEDVQRDTADYFKAGQEETIAQLRDVQDRFATLRDRIQSRQRGNG